jgi:hypothetical protein
MSDLVTNTKVDTSYFLQKWTEYRKVMSRTLPQAVNDKLFMVARASLWFTHKADKKDIEKTLGKVSVSTTKHGKKRYAHRLVKAAQHDAPLIALIINKRRGKGEGLRGEAMRAEVQRVLSARMRSRAYIKSGWLPAIKELAAVTSVPTKFPFPDDAVQIGKVKGRAETAKEGDIIKGFIENEAYATRDNKGAFERFGSKGLQAGIDNEGKEMDVYIKRKIQPAADAFNASQR